MWGYFIWKGKAIHCTNDATAAQETSSDKTLLYPTIILTKVRELKTSRYFLNPNSQQ